MSRLYVQSEGTAARRRFPLYLVDATDGITAETGESGGQPQISKAGGAWANTTATLTAIGNGAYYVELTAAELDTLGMIQVRYKSANTAEFNMDGEVLALNIHDTVRAGLTALPNVASGSAGAIITAGTGTAQLSVSGGRGNADLTHIATVAVSTTTAQLGVNVVQAGATAWGSGAITAGAIAADAITAAKIADGAIDAATFAAGAINAAAIAADAITDAKVAADVTIASVTGSVGSVTGAVGSVTGNVGGNVVGSVASVVAGVTLAASAVQAIWDALTSALTTVGSIGKLLVDNINATISSRSSHSAADVWAAGTRTLTAATNIAGPIADQVWEEAIADHSGTVGSTAAALNAAGSAGDPWATALPGAYGAGTAGKIIGDNINATISSRATQASVDVIDGIVDAILVDTGTDIPATLATIAGYIDTEISAIQSALVTINTAVVTSIPTTLAGMNTKLDTIDDFLDTEIAAIKAKTDNLPSSVDGKTLQEWFQIVGAMAGGEVSGAGTATEIFTGLDGSTVRITATVDASGNRSAVVFS